MKFLNCPEKHSDHRTAYYFEAVTQRLLQNQTAELVMKSGITSDNTADTTSSWDSLSTHHALYRHLTMKSNALKARLRVIQRMYLQESLLRLPLLHKLKLYRSTTYRHLALHTSTYKKRQTKMAENVLCTHVVLVQS